MASKKLELTAGQSAGLSILAVMAANWLSVKYSGYPFAYCWLSPLVIPIWEPIAGLVHVFSMLALLWYAVTRQARGTLLAGLVLVGIFGLPLWADILFRMGGSCG
ncbi:MAG: hypothetical protein R3D70_05735 [Rhizobiaceae bacterium]